MTKLMSGDAMAPTYGLSFLDDGRCNWQFVIDKMSEHAATITTFSWITGLDYSVEHVSRDFLRERCILFANRETFLDRANYWGDARVDRKNIRLARP